VWPIKKEKQIVRFNKIWLITLLFLLCSMAMAQSGSLDLSFGNNGTAVTNIQNWNLGAPKAVIQRDGKILALYDIHGNRINGATNLLVRYNANGLLDPGFGNGGVVNMNWNSPTNIYGNASDIAVQFVGGEEKVVVAGTGSGGSSTLRVDRYNANGSQDASFGSNGKVSLNTGYASAVAVQPDGKIVTIGDAGYMARLNVNGTIDTSFGNGGTAPTSIITGWALAVQFDGKIIAAGGPNSGRNSMTVARFNANGSVDDGSRKDPTPGDSFGSGGKISIDFFPNGYSATANANAIQIDRNGRVIVAGIAWRNSNDANKDFAVARLTPNGLLDPTFDGDGKAVFDLSGAQDQERGVALQADGKILLTGLASSSNPNNQNMGLIRLNPNGTLDPLFGNGGIQINNISSENEGNYVGVMQFDPNCGCEKFVVTGTVQFNGIYSAFTARYLP
jgi:uncharacterized delta-60 repeat protein